MNTRKYSLAIGFGLLWLAIFGISNSFAAPSQWFPDDATIIDYTLTNYVNWKNGTASYSSQFNVYNVTSDLYICPTKLDQVRPLPTGWPLIKANAVIQMRHVYAEATPTTLNRTTYFLMDNITLPCNIEINFVIDHSNTSCCYCTMQATTNYTYQKSTLVDPPTGDTTDYFDCTVTPGEMVMSAYTVMAKTSERITATKIDLIAANCTYVADLTGKVSSYTVVADFGVDPPSPLRNTAYMFETIPYSGTNGVPAITHPSDMIYPAGATGNSITWTVTDASTGITNYTIYRNGTSIATGSWIDGMPKTLNVDGLSVGVYNYTILAADGYGDSVKDTVFVTVSNVALTITHPSDITYSAGITGTIISWTVTDGSTGATSYTIYRNSMSIATGSWTSGTPMTLNVEGLSSGIYTYTIIATDGYGDSVQDTVIVTIVTPASPPLDLLTIVVVSVAIAVGVIVLILAVKRKSRKHPNQGSNPHAP